VKWTAEGDRLLQNGFARVLRQYRVTRGVNMISPGLAFQYTAETLLGSGMARYLDFERQVWRYRDTLRDFLHGRDAADPASPHLLFLSSHLSREPLNPTDIPRFHQTPMPIGRGVANGLILVLLLIFEAGLAFVLATRAVTRMDLSE
jgi:hypothetical protein